MKTNLIEITVSGRTGTGKSEVLEVIKVALAEFYGNGPSHVKVAGVNPDGAIHEARATKQSAKITNTVFVLYEQNISGPIKIHG